MQLGIPVSYNVCEVKPDNINHWICVYREEFVSCDSIINYKLIVGLVVVYYTITTDKFLSVYTYPVVYNIRFYFTYIVSSWDPNLHFTSQFM
jgi:hypothetical protein